MLYNVFFKDGELAMNSGIPSADIDSGLIPLSANVIKDFEQVQIDLVVSPEDYEREVNGVWLWASDICRGLVVDGE